MEIKLIQPISVYGKKITTSLKTMQNSVGNIPESIISEAFANELQIMGPQIWQYNGADGNPDTIFELLITVPVNRVKEQPGIISQLPEFKYLSLMHYGDWNLLGNSYCKVFNYITQNNIVSSNICREVYLEVDFQNPDKNVTEIQFGII